MFKEEWCLLYFVIVVYLTVSFQNFTNFNRPSSVAFNAPQQPPTLPPFGGFDQNAAAAADKMAMNQYFNSPMNFGGMFSNDEGMNPRNPINPWANDNSIQSHVSTPPFGAQMDMPFGPGSNINKPAGVIGNGNMTRHNSMGSMGSNQYDMMRHNNDLRISCSPPISNLMGNVRPMVYNISTQTEQTIEQVAALFYVVLNLDLISYIDMYLETNRC